MATSRTRQQQTGFTLAELMTTLGVLSISMAIAVPGYKQLVQNNRRTTAVNEFVSTLHVARSLAITRNAQVTICPSSNGQQCAATAWRSGWIWFADQDRNRQVNGAETVAGARAASPHLEISSENFPTFIAYRPNGRVAGATLADNTGQFLFCDDRGPDEARLLDISTSGEPRLIDNNLPACGS